MRLTVTKRGFLIGAHIVLIALAITFNVHAYFQGYWNLLVGQSLLLCPLMAVIGLNSEE
jgi:hypothetical protein